MPDGDIRRALESYLRAIQHFPELVFDAVRLLVDGDGRFAAGLLTSVASFDDRVDLIGADILEARALLELFGGYHAHWSSASVGALDHRSSIGDVRPMAKAELAVLSWMRAPDGLLSSNPECAQAALSLASKTGVAEESIHPLEQRLTALTPN
jgi:hypothetical protein